MFFSKLTITAALSSSAIATAFFVKPNAWMSSNAYSRLKVTSMSYIDKIDAMKAVWESTIGPTAKDFELGHSNYVIDVAKHMQSCIDSDIVDNIQLEPTASSRGLRVVKKYQKREKFQRRPLEPDEYLFPQVGDDNLIMEETKRWVKAIIADFAVCPFTIEPDRAGIPRGNVYYE